jgi:hypothetical protein
MAIQNDPLNMPNQKSLTRYDWRSGITDQNSLIDSMGVDALTNARQAAQRRLDKEAADRETALNNAAISGARANQSQFANVSAAQSAQNAKAPTGGFGKFMAAISKQESGGNYNAINSSSGAMGKYQIMPSNILGTRKGWDWEVLGRDINTAEFINNPQLQEQIASAKLQGYYNKYGPAGAAIAWYAGPGAAQNYARSGRASTGSQGAFPSISGYMQSVLKRMGYA